MKIKIRIRLYVWLMAVIFGVLPVIGQRTMDVTGFQRQEKDLLARVTRPVRDHDEGKLCALIRIISPLTDLQIRPDALGMVEQTEQNGETWVYVPYGARSLSISHAGYVPVMYQYPIPIEEGMVYEMRLNVNQEGASAPSASTTQMLALTVRPEDATVFIDEVEFPVDNGVVLASMNKGEHRYLVQAPMYEDASGEVELGDTPVRENVALFPMFATLNVSTLPDHGFEVRAGTKVIGETPVRDYRVDPGTYRLHISRKNYHPLDTTVRLRAGQVMDLTCRLTSFADSLFYNRRLGGRTVSFGLRAGYLQPMVSTDSKGGFTGSAINYGLGTSKENVQYTGQTGFTAGLIVDIRLIKNLYLQTGVDYSYMRYTNKFKSRDEDVVLSSTPTTVVIGTRDNAYTEQYTYHEIQVPVMASYRFVLSKRSSLHLNLGPYISYGISAKMKLNGSTDGEGIIYGLRGGFPNYDDVKGNIGIADHTTGTIDLYSKTQKLTVTSEHGGNTGYTQHPRFNLKSSPLRRLNYGLAAGCVYELSRFQIGVTYAFELSNRAESAFWKSDRISLFNTPAQNLMGSYRHNIHTLAVTLGYVLR